MNGRVAVIKTRPETVLEDTERVMKIAVLRMRWTRELPPSQG